ncbi:MAG: hypothetical protein DMG69_14930 [Acidobacteria bacterium]|nr:MAG: hypothetical protein DMG69_14930 [Acidobacteriota bacterium]
MKIVAIICTATLGLLLGAPPLASAQRDHDDGGKADSHAQQGNNHQKNHRHSAAQQYSDRGQANGPERREQRPHQQKWAKQNRPERQQPRHPQARGPQSMREANWHEQEQHFRPRDIWQSQRAQHWRREHHSWRERGGYRGYRIPEDRFRAYFGGARWFRVHNLPIIELDGYPRFQYAGFWFSMIDPWPESWSRTWYETDDVYIDYVNDGYYIYNRRHPGVAIAVNVSF